MLKQSAVLLAICLLAALIPGCTIAQPESVIASQPHSWIDAPLNGSALPIAPVQVVSHSTDSFQIVSVELSVNANVIQTTPNTDSSDLLALTKQTWSPNAPGNYVLRVRAMNSNNVWGEIAQAVVTIGLQTPTPTVTPTKLITPTPFPAVGITFFADQTQLTRGQCTMIHWQVTNASQVFLDNAPVTASGEKQDCPAQTVTHTLRVVTLDNQTVQRELTIQFVQPTNTRPAPQPTPTHTPTPTVRFLITIPPIFFPTDTPTKPPPR